MAESRALCLLCRVGRERLAVRASDVLKVVGQARLCRLPRLPKEVAGITHHRGRIVTVFDAGVLLFDAPRAGEPGPDARVVVLDRGQRHLALAVDGVDEIEPIRLAAADGGALQPGPMAAVRVAEHRGQAVFAVDADRLVARMLQASEDA